MLKFRTPVVIFVMTFLIISIVPSWSQDKKPEPKHAPNALPGVEPAMLTPEYWIALQEDADAVIMTPLQIERFNEKLRNNELATSSYEGGLINPILPLGLPDTLPGDSLKVMLKRDIEQLFSPDKLYGSEDFYDGRNAIYNDKMKQDIVDDMNIELVIPVIKFVF